MYIKVDELSSSSCGCLEDDKRVVHLPQINCIPSDSMSHGSIYASSSLRVMSERYIMGPEAFCPLTVTQFLEN